MRVNIVSTGGRIRRIGFDGFAYGIDDAYGIAFSEQILPAVVLKGKLHPAFMEDNFPEAALVGFGNRPQPGSFSDAV